MAREYKGRYVGPVAHLQGQEAIIRPDPLLAAEASTLAVPWLAQFDDTDLTLNEEHLGFGWHLFDRESFKVLYPLGEEYRAAPDDTVVD